MAGRRWFAEGMLCPRSMGWWWCLIILAMGECRGVLAAESAAIPQPSAAVAQAEEGGCYRPLSDVIWGFLVTLLALTVSLWGSVKHKADHVGVATLAILFGLFAPLEDLGEIIHQSLQSISLLWKCHKMGYPNSRMTSPLGSSFCAPLFPWSKSVSRILASCYIVVYVSKESPLLEKKWLWTERMVTDKSEALVVGENGARAFRNDQYQRKELSEEGIGWLVWKEVFFKAEDSKRLPKYGELKYLRGNSGFAVLAIAVQALGYIYAVGFRSAKNLRISPLEVIGLVFNIILLIKVLFYSTCNPCYRPLVIYMDADWEDEVAKCNDDDQKKFECDDLHKIRVVLNSGIFIGLITLLICFIVNIYKATNIRVALPIIVFLSGLSLSFLGLQITDKDLNSDHRRGIHINRIGFLVNAVAYIWGIVVTIVYWRTMHFNTRGDLINLSQIIPFIG